MGTRKNVYVDLISTSEYSVLGLATAPDTVFRSLLSIALDVLSCHAAL